MYKIKKVVMVGVEEDGSTIADTTIVQASNRKYYLVQEIGVNRRTGTKMWEKVRQSGSEEFHKIYKHVVYGCREYMIEID